MNHIRATSRVAAAWAAVLAVASATATVRAGPLRVTDAARFDFEAPAVADRRLLAEELSGIAWMGGDRYVAIGDQHACLQFLTIRLDPATGAVKGVRFGRPVLLRDEHARPLPDSTEGRDREGILYDRSSGTVWIANERTGRDGRRSSLARHSVRDGRRIALITTDSHPALRAFAGQPENRGFESLTGRGDGRETWSGNEGPLVADGRPATVDAGGVVRLIRFDQTMRPVAQYAYVVDPYPARIKSPALLRGHATSGLSDLLLLPDGRLLALERAFAGDSTGTAGFRIRIYEVDSSGATNVLRPPFAEGLAGKSYSPARKHLLWERHFGIDNSNFEGITLGPRLRNGDRALLLVADNDGGRAEALYVLRLSGFVE
jgi:Esterase-like activity of phytase